MAKNIPFTFEFQEPMQQLLKTKNHWYNWANFVAGICLEYLNNVIIENINDVSLCYMKCGRFIKLGDYHKHSWNMFLYYNHTTWSRVIK